MLMTIVTLALAVNGGLYVGTIAYSAYRSAKHARSLPFFQRAGIIHLI